MASDDNFSSSLRLTKPALRSTGGIVAAQHRRAAEIGAAVLGRGGDAVDALIATSFALGALEPWMSGIGGGGAMVLYRAKENRYAVIDFGMRAPAALNVADFALTGEGVASDLFPWPRVVGDHNIHGALAIAVPGLVDGMGIAHQNFARLPWEQLLAPAIECAEQGLLVDWFTLENIATAALDLRRYRASSEIFLRDGLPPVPAWSARAQTRLRIPNLARSLQAIAHRGAREFYEGETARRVVEEVREHGGALTLDDLRGYRARVVEPRSIGYRGARVQVTPELTAGPSLVHVLRTLGESLKPGSAPDAASYLAYARALQQAYRFRLARMGDAPDARAPGCTSHFCAVDGEGNMAAVTQTLLSVFGSRFTLGETGVVMNNGIMWFDPEPGKPNSLAPGKRCLTNYCPVIAERGTDRFALGASGGRRILPAVTQLLSFIVDYGKTLEEALHLARIDASEGDLVIGDVSLAEDVQHALAQEFPYVRARRQSLPFKFACPSAVARVDGLNWGATEIGAPWADAVAQA